MFSKIGKIEFSGEKLFFISLTMSLISSFIINTTFMPYIQVKHLNWVNYLAIGILLIKIYIFDQWHLTEYLGITIILFLSFISWRKTNYNNLMVLITFILAGKNVDLKKVIQHYFNINFSLLLLVIIYSLIGVIRNLVFYRDGIVRMGMGIDYPTDLAAYVFYLILAYVYLHYQELHLLDYVSFSLIAIILNIVTNARLDVIAILLVIPIILAAKKAETSKRKITCFIPSYYWALSLVLPFIYILMTYFYNSSNNILKLLNKLLSGRLEYGNLAFSRYGITSLGQKVVEHGWGGLNGYKMSHSNPFNYFYIDSTYVRLMVIYGLILGIIIMLMVLFISVRSTLNNSYLLPAIILLVTISSLIDTHMLEINYNPFLIALFANIAYTTGGFKNEQ